MPLILFFRFWLRRVVSDITRMDGPLWWAGLFSPVCAELYGLRQWFELISLPSIKRCALALLQIKQQQKKALGLGGQIWDNERPWWLTWEHIERTGFLFWGQFFRNNHGQVHTNSITTAAGDISQNFLWEWTETGLNPSALRKLERKKDRFPFLTIAIHCSIRVSVLYNYYSMFQQYCWRMSAWR